MLPSIYLKNSYFILFSNRNKEYKRESFVNDEIIPSNRFKDIQKEMSAIDIKNKRNEISLTLNHLLIE